MTMLDHCYGCSRRSAGDLAKGSADPDLKQPDAGGALVSLQESWVETSGELRDLLLSIVGWVANFESRRRSERIKAGLDRRRAAGLTVGRKPGAKDRKPRRVSGYYVRHGR